MPTRTRFDARGLTTLLLPILLVLFSGCAATPRSNMHAPCLAEQEQIKQVLNEIFEAAQTKDMSRLDGYHLYGPKFTKFAAEQNQRQDAALARQGEHAGLLAAEDLSMRADDLQVDVFENAGVATFLLNYSVRAGGNTLHLTNRATMVFVRENGDWKIVHEHFSVPRPAP